MVLLSICNCSIGIGLHVSDDHPAMPLFSCIEFPFDINMLLSCEVDYATMCIKVHVVTSCIMEDCGYVVVMKLVFW